MVLREFVAGDADSLAKHANDPAVAEFLREIFPSPYTLQDAQWWVSEGHKLNNSCNRAIVVDGECVGNIGANFGSGEHRFTAEIGYWLGRNYWGQGIVTEAVAVFTGYLFSNYELQRIIAPVAHENVASIAVLKKSGFSREGVLRNNMYLRGKFYDEHIYACYR